MQNPLDRLNKDRQDYLRYFLLIASVLIITLVIPKTGRFKYEFELGKPWKHDDLIAPFSFAIQKSEDQIAREKQEIRNNFKPIYYRDESIPKNRKKKLAEEIVAQTEPDKSIDKSKKKYYLTRGEQFLDEIYERGVINLDTATKDKPEEFIITELRNSVGEDKQLASYYKIGEAKSSIIDRVQKDTILNKAWFIRAVSDQIDYNILYDSTLSNEKLRELLGDVSPTRGMVRQDEKIIGRGGIVTEERYMVLNSLRKEYESKGGKNYLLYIGYLVLVASLFLIYAINLEVFFYKDVTSPTRGIILILINILLFTCLTAFIVDRNAINVYLIPYCIVPIVLLAFFGLRIAFITHVLVVLICGLMVPNPFEFVLLQMLAGFTAILSMVRIRYISQFFISALLVFLTYCLVYLGLTLIKSNVLEEIVWTEFMWFGGNFILTLLAYPLIYANEKIFGYLSDISLLELSDINNKLLKELFLRAPGTFQHSLQVSNLAEAVIDRIGGNALLTRVGALYHDIGKLHNPDYFIENQKFGLNPHDQLTDVESADIIIGHVSKGIEIAQENNLPKKVIDFIRTHHGTTRVEYFYKHYLNEHEEEEVDDTIFRYPGPKPSSKEMAVVMIVDSVEAASRSIKEPDEKQIDNLVDKIIDHKIQDNQFDYATITIQEINTVRRILKKLVKSIYHIRIQYPVEPGLKKNF